MINNLNIILFYICVGQLKILKRLKKEANKWFNRVKKKIDEKLGKQIKLENLYHYFSVNS